MGNKGGAHAHILHTHCMRIACGGGTVVRVSLRASGRRNSYAAFRTPSTATPRALERSNLANPAYQLAWGGWCQCTHAPGKGA